MALTSMAMRLYSEDMIDRSTPRVKTRVSGRRAEEYPTDNRKLEDGLTNAFHACANASVMTFIRHHRPICLRAKSNEYDCPFPRALLAA